MTDLLTCGLFIAGTRGHTPIQCACFLRASSMGFPRRLKKGVSPWGGEVAGASVRVAAVPPMYAPWSRTLSGRRQRLLPFIL